jgi:heat shock protein HslJ
MKHYTKPIVRAFLVVTVLAVTVILMGACGTPSLKNNDWNLIEARVKPADIIFDRSMLTTEGFGEIFTLRFEDARVSGVAAPNRYSAPYKADKQTLTIQQVSGTRMTPLSSPEKLREQDFFAYLQSTYKWGIVNKNLELYSKNEDGAEVVLIFALAGKK